MLVPDAWAPSPANEARSAAYIAAHGAAAYQAAGSSGQCARADGLFYGGTKPAWSNATFRDVVRRHADGWNLPAPAAHRLDELRPQAGAARVSTQHLVALVPTGADRQEIEHRIRSRFPGMGEGLVVGDARRLRAHFEDLAGRGVQRCYVWFADRAPVDTIAAFADGVIEPLSGRSA